MSHEYPHSAVIEWRGRKIRVDYDPAWSAHTAHLQLTTVYPERDPLPMTDTGYRSLFLPDLAEAVDAAGGPVCYALDWLNASAEHKGWVDHGPGKSAPLQMSLF